MALLRHARCLATLALSVGMIGATSAAWAQTPSAAEEAIKKALQTGQLAQARQLVQKERQNAPQAVQWRFMEGVIQAQQGQIDTAIETFTQITQTHPEHSEAFNNLGVLYASKGELETSKTYLEKALQTHPSYAAAHRNLSDVHSQLAKQSYAKALQVDPKAKASAPQLTLLGSMGGQPRGQQPPAQNVASLTRPATPAAGQASGQAPAATSNAASASAPTVAATPAAAAVNVAKATSSAPAAASTATASVPGAPSMAPAKPSATVAVATPAAAPAAPSTGKPAADERQADRAAIEKAVRDWAKAWSNKDMPRYYAAYANNFIPANRASRSQWESDRRIRIVSKKSISVEVREMKVNFTGETASVRFQQLYTSDNLKGSSRKTLEMVRQGNRWLIVRESVN